MVARGRESFDIGDKESAPPRCIVTQKRKKKNFNNRERKKEIWHRGGKKKSFNVKEREGESFNARESERRRYCKVSMLRRGKEGDLAKLQRQAKRGRDIRQSFTTREREGDSIEGRETCSRLGKEREGDSIELQHQGEGEREIQQSFNIREREKRGDSVEGKKEKASMPRREREREIWQNFNVREKKREIQQKLEKDLHPQDALQQKGEKE